MSTHRPTQLRQRRNRIIFFFFRVLASGFWWDVLIRNLGGRKWANRTALKRYVNHARRFRALAIDLKINPNTIAKSYGELEIRGIVTTQVGSGTYVSDKRIDMEDAERTKKLEATLARFVRDMEALGVDRAAMAELVRDFEED